MVRAELREAGIEALGMEMITDVEDALARGFVPSLIVLDGAELENETARKSVEELAHSVAVLVVDSRISPAPAVPGTEVLWRPMRVQDVVSRVCARLNRNTA